MNNEVESVVAQGAQRPQLFVSSITFSDGSMVNLTHKSIVVFSGSNNCGKSQALRDIEELIKGSHVDKVVAKNLSKDEIGEIDKAFVVDRFYHGDDGNYWLENSGTTVEQWAKEWSKHTLHRLYRLFLNRLDTEERLIASKAKRLFGNDQVHERSSLHSAYEHNSIEDSISKFFNEAFMESLIVNRRAGINISLHVGKRPIWEGQREGEGKYYDAVNSLPILDKQGDGMRSFASILLDTFTSEYTITLIDEPEAFLHPPQARILGKMLAKYNTGERQLFIATHSADFINGLLDADNNNVIVIHINRVGNTNYMNTLGNEKIKELWNKPLLRYSNILNGLFHEKVIICESEYDCLFYRALLDAIYEGDENTAPDIMFTQCGGKDRMEYAVAALTALKVPVVAIPDFDIIDNSMKLRKLVAAFGIDWDSVSSNMDIIFACINAENGKLRSLIKKNGPTIFTGKAPQAFRTVDAEFRSCGLFIVPVGEIESFDKTINEDKKDWVYGILGRGELNSDERLEPARKFVKAIVAYKPQYTKD